jgi:hypothetical protein
MTDVVHWKTLQDKGLIIKGASIFRLKIIPEMLDWQNQCILLVKAFDDNKQSKVWRKVLFDREFAIATLKYTLSRLDFQQQKGLLIDYLNYLDDGVKWDPNHDQI